MSQRLHVNPIACEAHGMCGELLPERVTLDEWGYPIVDARPLDASLIENARRAAQRGAVRARRSPPRAGELLQVVASRSLLVDVHLLGDRQ